MKIAVIGTGMVGGALGKRWSELGHKVMYGVRSMDSPKGKLLLNDNSELAGMAEAAAWADVVVLSVPYGAVQDVVAALGSVTGKILLDCTNPLKGLESLTVGLTTSTAGQISERAKGANVMKIYKNDGDKVKTDGAVCGGKPLMLYAGDDDESKLVAHNLAFELGFDPVDAGPLTQARLLEPLALLWITLAYHQGVGREFAFRLMKR